MMSSKSTESKSPLRKTGPLRRVSGFFYAKSNLITALLATAIGIPLAFAFVRHDFPGKSLVRASVCWHHTESDLERLAAAVGRHAARR